MSTIQSPNFTSLPPALNRLPETPINVHNTTGASFHGPILADVCERSATFSIYHPIRQFYGGPLTGLRHLFLFTDRCSQLQYPNSSDSEHLVWKLYLHFDNCPCPCRPQRQASTTTCLQEERPNCRSIGHRGIHLLWGPIQYCCIVSTCLISIVLCHAPTASTNRSLLNTIAYRNHRPHNPARLRQRGRYL